MRSLRSKKRRSALRTGGMEVMGAMSVATQMALLCPPGFDEWLHREFAGGSAAGPHSALRPTHHAR